MFREGFVQAFDRDIAAVHESLDHGLAAVPEIVTPALHAELSAAADRLYLPNIDVLRREAIVNPAVKGDSPIAYLPAEALRIVRKTRTTPVNLAGHVIPMLQHRINNVMPRDIPAVTATHMIGQVDASRAMVQAIYHRRAEQAGEDLAHQLVHTRQAFRPPFLPYLGRTELDDPILQDETDDKLYLRKETEAHLVEYAVMPDNYRNIIDRIADKFAERPVTEEHFGVLPIFVHLVRSGQIDVDGRVSAAAQLHLRGRLMA